MEEVDLLHCVAVYKKIKGERTIAETVSGGRAMNDETSGPMTRRRIPHYTAIYNKTTSCLFIILNIFRMTERLNTTWSHAHFITVYLQNSLHLVLDSVIMFTEIILCG